MNRTAQLIRRVAAVTALGWVLFDLLVILRNCPIAGAVCEPQNVLLTAGLLPLGLLVGGGLVAWMLEHRAIFRVRHSAPQLRESDAAHSAPA